MLSLFVLVLREGGVISRLVWVAPGAAASLNWEVEILCPLKSKSNVAQPAEAEENVAKPAETEDYIAVEVRKNVARPAGVDKNVARPTEIEEMCTLFVTACFLSLRTIDL